MGEKPRELDDAAERKDGEVRGSLGSQREAGSGGVAGGGAGETGGSPEPVEGTINNSKSNNLRQAAPDDDEGSPDPSEATTVKSSKSNSSE